MFARFLSQILMMAGTLFLILTMNSCAGDQQQVQGGLENYEYEGGEGGEGGEISNSEAEAGGNNFGGGNYSEEEGGDNGAEDNYEYGGNTNLTSNNSAGGNYDYGTNNSNASAGGEMVNNALDEELFTNESLTNDGVTGQALNNASTDSEVVADAALVNSGFDANASASPSAGQSANALPDTSAISEVPGPSVPPPPGGIVKYILGDTSMLDGPGGNAVKKLSRGDHPVVYDMGEYHQTMEGYVIPSTSLTTEATGRPRTPSFWR